MKMSLNVVRITARTLVGVAAVIFATSARGSIVTSSPLLPAIDYPYVTPAQVHALFNSPAPGIDHIELYNIQHIPTFLSSGSPSGSDWIETFTSDLVGLANVFFTGGGEQLGVPVAGHADITQVIVKNYSPGDLGTFDTEMLSMDISGSVGGVYSFEMRESPTESSTGQTVITALTGEGPPLYNITSFFDVWPEISLPGTGWTSSEDSVYVEVIPEPSGLVAGTTVFLCFAAACGLGRLKALRRLAA